MAHWKLKIPCQYSVVSKNGSLGRTREPLYFGPRLPKMAKVAKIRCETVVGKVPRLAQDLTGISPNPKQGVFFHILRPPGPEKAALMSYFASEHDYFLPRQPIYANPVRYSY